MSPVKPYQQKIIDLYIQQELKLAELYKLLSETVPALLPEFSAMAAEELNHAQWVEYLGRNATRGSVVFHEDNTRSYTLQAFLDHIAAAIKRVKETALNPQEALALSINMEDSLLERKVFDHFQGDSADVARVLKRLHTETAEQLAKVRKLSRSYRDADGNLPASRPGK